MTQAQIEPLPLHTIRREPIPNEIAKLFARAIFNEKVTIVAHGNARDNFLDATLILTKLSKISAKRGLFNLTVRRVLVATRLTVAVSSDVWRGGIVSSPNRVVKQLGSEF
jgi:hypothetical protein